MCQIVRCGYRFTAQDLEIKIFLIGSIFFGFKDFFKDYDHLMQRDSGHIQCCLSLHFLSFN